MVHTRKQYAHIAFYVFKAPVDLETFWRRYMWHSPYLFFMEKETDRERVRETHAVNFWDDSFLFFVQLFSCINWKEKKNMTHSLRHQVHIHVQLFAINTIMLNKP